MGGGPQAGAWAERPPLAWRLLLGLALLQAALHLGTNGRWGPFRDELYYLACADHLAWGYVDHPPLSIALLTAWRALIGAELIWGIRLLPTAAGAALIFLTGLLARELGGRRAAQGLAAGAVLIAPAILATTAFYSMNAFEPLVWVGATLILMRILRAPEPGRCARWPGSGPSQRWCWCSATASHTTWRRRSRSCSPRARWLSRLGFSGAGGPGCPCSRCCSRSAGSSRCRSA